MVPTARVATHSLPLVADSLPRRFPHSSRILTCALQQFRALGNDAEQRLNTLREEFQRGCRVSAASCPIIFSVVRCLYPVEAKQRRLPQLQRRLKLLLLLRWVSYRRLRSGGGKKDQTAVVAAIVPVGSHPISPAGLVVMTVSHLHSPPRYATWCTTLTERSSNESATAVHDSSLAIPH